jgi:hypothetical protein
MSYKLSTICEAFRLNIETFVNKKPALMRSALKDLAIVVCLHKDTISNGRCVDSLEKGVRTGSKRCAKMIELHIQHK